MLAGSRPTATRRTQSLPRRRVSRQARLDVAQAFAPGQLREGHRPAIVPEVLLSIMGFSAGTSSIAANGFPLHLTGGDGLLRSVSASETSTSAAARNIPRLSRDVSRRATPIVEVSGRQTRYAQPKPAAAVLARSCGHRHRCRAGAHFRALAPGGYILLLRRHHRQLRTEVVRPCRASRDARIGWVVPISGGCSSSAAKVRT